MKTILVPTDYSDTALNAARYAIRLASQLHVEKIVFYNAYQVPPVVSEPAMPAIPYVDVETLKAVSEEGMDHFKKRVEPEIPEGISVETISEFAILSDEASRLCERTGATLIVMGIKGTSRMEEVLIGSTAISVMKHTTVPVIIVPHQSTYTAINNIALATDLKNVAETLPVTYLSNILRLTGARLHVVNVYEDQGEISADRIHQQELLKGILKEFSPGFHVINSGNFVDGINHFVQTNNIDLVMAIPKKHGLFSTLFRERHTKHLAFHTHVPLMYMHQEEL